MQTARKNFILGVIHETLWGFGFGLINPYTILALAAIDMGASKAVTGMLAAVLFAGQNFSQVFSALAFSPKFTQPRWTAAMNAVPLAGVFGAAALFLWMPGGGVVKVALVIACFLLYYVGLGAVVPHWMASMARCIPQGRLGRFFGTCFFSSNLFGAFAGFLASAWAVKGGLSWGYALACGIAGLVQVLSVYFLSLMKPVTAAPHPVKGGLGSNLAGLVKRWAASPPLRSVFLLTLLFILATSSGGFFTVFLKEVLQADKHWFVLYTPAMGLGSMAGAYAMGHLSDRRGPRQALFWGLGLTLTSILSISLFPPGPWHALSYFGAGFGGSNFVAFMVVVLKHAGRARRTVMTGFINTILSPFIFALPLLLNALALAAGYRWAFLVSGCACLAGFWVVAKVRSLDD